MGAYPASVLRVLLGIVIAGNLPQEATLDGPGSSGASASCPVEINGRTIQVAAPLGMSHAKELLPMYAGIGRSMGAEARAVFLPDSLLAALRAGLRPDTLMTAIACVADFDSEQSPTIDQVQYFFAYEWTREEQVLRSLSTDSIEFARVRSALQSDLEGRRNIPLPLGPRSRVGLAIHHLEDRAGITLQVSSADVQPAGRQGAVATLRAMATVIVRDRVICMFMLRNVWPTTGAVADLKRDSQAWVAKTLAANEDDALPEPVKGSGSVDSSESHPKFGDSVHVEEMPEAVRRTAPEYPDAARAAGVSGTVMVQALIGRDGRVKATRIGESIPALDRHAAAAVRQWVFKPARAKGQPASAWVAIPVKFTLH